MTNKQIVYTTIDPEIQALAEHHNHNPAAALEVLIALQAQHGALSQEAITDVARALRMPPQKAYGIASFYSMLTLTDKQSPAQPANTIRVCDGPVCRLCGSDKLRQAVDQVVEQHPDWTVKRTSCLGLCDRAPAVLVNEQQAGPIQPEQAAGLSSGQYGKPTDYTQPRPGEMRVMLAKAGLVDPDSIESALEHGAYQGLKLALQRSPDLIMTQVEAAGLAGRGGAGFPVGRKWRFVAQAPRKPKVIVCNADESEPLIFKDRVLMDTNPQQILEGMAIAGYACGAEEAYIYIRGEYASQACRLEEAIRQAEAAGWLGDHIQGSDFSFHIHVHRGAGAYICGEETALIESLEGKRGEPRTRPPYPPQAGYMNRPTLVNNVESYAAVPAIVINGSVWYHVLSTTNTDDDAMGFISEYHPLRAATTPGTKMYMLIGHVKKPGLFEAPFGLTLRQIIDRFGGGMRPGSTFHFALAGGAAGTLVPAGLLDIPVDYASAAKGVALGAGAFLICDQSVSPVAFLRNLLFFFRAESCGKCTPCRVGTHRATEILERLVAGQGQPGDVAELHALADVMSDSSFCGLGQSVPIPMRSTLKHFASDFAAAESQGQF